MKLFHILLASLPLFLLFGCVGGEEDNFASEENSGGSSYVYAIVPYASGVSTCIFDGDFSGAFTYSLSSDSPFDYAIYDANKGEMHGDDVRNIDLPNIASGRGSQSYSGEITITDSSGIGLDVYDNSATVKITSNRKMFCSA